MGIDGLGLIRVHMDLEHIHGLRHDERPTKLAELGADLVGRREPRALYEHFGAILVIPFRVDQGDGGRHHGRNLFLRDAPDRLDRFSIDQADHALDHPDKSLAAGVHHASLLEDSQ